MKKKLRFRNLKFGFRLICLLILISCSNDISETTAVELSKTINVQKISSDLATVRDYVMQNAVIAHRGSTFWVPEETEAAFRWGRNIGADYLEIDVQLTKDGVLLALHDDNLKRTTDIETKIPNKQDNYLYDLTFQEIVKLDAGTWFNNANPNQARASFVGQGISTFEDVIQIAQGKRVMRNADGTRKYDYNATTQKYTFYYENDPADNGNRPGVYAECKEPWLFPGIEQKIYDELVRLGWNIITNPATETQFFKDNKVNTGNTNGKFILQTFSTHSLLEIEKAFKGKVPTCYLLWEGDGFLKPSTYAPNYADAINFAVTHKAHFTGPSISGAPNNYVDLLHLWQANLTHKSGLYIHAYSFDTEEQMYKYYGLRFGKDANGNPTNSKLADAMFTNRSEITINFYINQGVRPKGIKGNDQDPRDVLTALGY